MLTAGLGAVQAGTLGYAVTDTGLVGTLDFNSGSFQSIGCVPAGCSGLAGGIGIGPGGALEVYDSAGGDLYHLNPATGGASLVGHTGISFSAFAGLGDGRLFGISQSGDLYGVSGATGAASLVSHLFDFSPDGFIGTGLAGNGTSLYFTYGAAPFAAVPQDNTLYRIDPNNGALTTVGPTNVLMEGFTDFFGTGFVAGRLYGFTAALLDDGMGGFNFGSGYEYTIDTATGAATLVGPYSAADRPLYGAAAAAPEPATLWLAGAALACVGLSRRRA
jgi:hypothetical protein